LYGGRPEHVKEDQQRQRRGGHVGEPAPPAAAGVVGEEEADRGSDRRIDEPVTRMTVL
jgi:hypothetical protein